jgi:hypothetical protein
MYFCHYIHIAIVGAVGMWEGPSCLGPSSIGGKRHFHGPALLALPQFPMAVDYVDFSCGVSSTGGSLHSDGASPSRSTEGGVVFRATAIEGTRYRNELSSLATVDDQGMADDKRCRIGT